MLESQSKAQKTRTWA